ncbi:MAG: ComF family protein [Clostridiales bacterium]|nr:ComF family protein [Clostridiales bacterium]
MNARRLLANLLSPPLCVFCGRAIDVRTAYNVCADCADSIPYNNKKACGICGAPLDISYGDLYCGACRHTKRAFARNVSRFVYKEAVADALRLMKFGKGNLWIADTLGGFLSQTVAERYGGIAFDAVLYVPVSGKRLRQRGFNQTEIIAEAVCEKLGLYKAEGILVKPKDTPKQSGLKIAERKANVREAFAVKNGDFLIDKTVLLIDDICTTGATLHACARTLKKAGAAVVYCATVASTEPGRG